MNRITDLEKLNQACRGSVRLRTLGIILSAAGLVLFVWLAQALRTEREVVAEVISGNPEAAPLESLIRSQLALALLLFAIVVVLFLLSMFLIVRPVQKNVAQILRHETLTLKGVYEIRCMAASYNLMVEENRKHNQALRYMVEHDHLTGLLNRGSFDMLRKQLENDPIALLIIDVDKFKDVNDTYGHDMGDRVLKRVGWLLGHAFRAGDHPFRIGGDEFAVIMSDMNSGLKQAVLDKIEYIKKGLDETEGRLPKVTLSIGVAFREQCGPEEEIFKLADAALYRVKNQGRNGCAFYDPAVDNIHHEPRHRGE